jgi:hypothetical protein
MQTTRLRFDQAVAACEKEDQEEEKQHSIRSQKAA